MDWTKLTTYDDWAGKLAELLNEAHDAIAKGDVNEKLQAQRDLNEFIDNCASPIKGKELDEIASQAIGNIFEAGLEQSMAEMGKRTAELTALTKEVSAITDHANAAAAAIRLDKVRAVADAASKALDTVNDLKQQLTAKSPDKGKISDNIDALVGILQQVYKQVGDLNS